MSRAWCLLLLAAVARLPGVDDDRFAWAVEVEPRAVGTIASDSIDLAVDLSDLPSQGLAHARALMPVPERGELVFPLWIPGTHAPSGPVANLGLVRLRDDRGREVQWERDPHDPWTLRIHPAAGAARLRVDLTYIANHSDANSVGVDIASGANHGLVNWNCCCFYPAGADVSTVPCALSVRLPHGWDEATALRERQRDDDIVRYATLPLAEIIDRPMLLAPRLQRLVLRPAEDGAEVLLHIAGEKPGARLADEATLVALRRLPDEARALFGGEWFPRFDMLLLLGESDLGLEHATSSVNGERLEDLIDPHHAWARELLPHEYVHAWVGKRRRPVGMLMRDLQAPPVLDGLWIYEGLTDLLGGVLAVRSGLVSPEDWRAELAKTIIRLGSQPGRRWRSLRDTCRCSWQLRGYAPMHADLRRGQDYYTEGALFWLAAERIIAHGSGGRRSLDDFCRAAFGPGGATDPGFSEAQIVETLGALAPVDWTGLVHRWIDGTGDLDVDALLADSGWRLDRVVIDPTDDAALTRLDPEALAQATGLTMSGGWIYAVAPGSPASGLGLKPGDFIWSADGVELKTDHLALTRALARGVAPRAAQLYVCRKDVWRMVAMSLPSAISADALVRIESQPDAFARLLTPSVAAHPAPEAHAPAGLP